MGPPQHAVPLVRVLLDVLEEVRRPEDAQPSRGARGEDVPEPGCQRESQQPPRLVTLRTRGHVCGC